MRPPSLLSLTLDSALLRIAHLSDLSRLPDHLLIDLFRVGTPASPESLYLVCPSRFGECCWFPAVLPSSGGGGVGLPGLRLRSACGNCLPGLGYACSFVCAISEISRIGNGKQ
ncbi:hypothetical protein ABZP36_006828 [Zizania latifolia]